MQAWLAAGHERLSNFGSDKPIPRVVYDDLRKGLITWNRYLREADGEASSDLAGLASSSYFELVEIGSRRLDEIKANVAGAAKAQQIVVSHSADLYTLSNLAVYHYFNGEFAAGDDAAKYAAADAQVNVKAVVQQLREYRKRGQRFRRDIARAAKELRRSGGDELHSRVKGYGSPAGINGLANPIRH
jgi:hypothetical protein